MTVAEAFKRYPGPETELLLAHVLGKAKEFLFLHPEHKLSALQATKLAGLLKRRGNGEPVAYLLGYRDFLGLRLKVDKRALIPRPETELMAEKAAEAVKALSLGILAGKPVRILDVGTGSGAIAISLAKKLAAGKIRHQVFAGDISREALVLARANAKRHGARVRFFQSDLLKKAKPGFEILLANLPYGWQAWKNNSSAETAGLRFEPRLALFAAEDGLREIRRLLEQVAGLAQKPAKIFLECDPRQKARLSRLAKKILPSWRQEWHKDYAGRWRFTELSRIA